MFTLHQAVVNIYIITSTQFEIATASVSPNLEFEK